jgi:hypothetical protein
VLRVVRYEHRTSLEMNIGNRMGLTVIAERYSS